MVRREAAVFVALSSAPGRNIAGCQETIAIIGLSSNIELTPAISQEVATTICGVIGKDKTNLQRKCLIKGSKGVSIYQNKCWNVVVNSTIFNLVQKWISFGQNEPKDYMVENFFTLAPYLVPFRVCRLLHIYCHIGFKRCSHIPKLSLEPGGQLKLSSVLSKKQLVLFKNT